MREALRKTQYMQANGGQPPPPDRNASGYGWGDRRPVTPEVARSFFFNKCVWYGIVFGAIYGAFAGLPFFIVGAFYGAPIGAILGLVLGVIDGVVLSYYAGELVSQGLPAVKVADKVWDAAPLTTLIAGMLILIFIFIHYEGQFRPLDSFIVVATCPIAVFASWHAACIAARKFIEEYE